MANPTTDKPTELTASDILSPQLWTGRAARPALGLDVTCTKIAVDLQNMTREGAEQCVHNSLEALREASNADCAFVALLKESLHFDAVQVVRNSFAQCRPEALQGESLDAYPWLRGRLEHLRLSELRDSTLPRREQRAEARRFAELGIASALIVAFRIRGEPAGFLAIANSLPRGAFDVNLQLLLKLLGTSLASGLERIRVADHLARVEERLALSQEAANDGVWTSTSSTTRCTSRRAGRTCSATPMRISRAASTGGASCTRMT